jgi:peptidoglycan/LPS O-acetylase OafA/YrhL
VAIWRGSPLKILYHGLMWVYVFFILSGFVLPLRFFKTQRTSCLWGAVFRRYFRLAIPLAVNLSLYYLVIKVKGNYDYDWGIHKFIKLRSYFDFLCDATFGVFMGYRKYSEVVWTMEIELWGTFALFLVVLIA